MGCTIDSKKHVYSSTHFQKKNDNFALSASSNNIELEPNIYKLKYQRLSQKSITNFNDYARSSQKKIIKKGFLMGYEYETKDFTHPSSIVLDCHSSFSFQRKTDNERKKEIDKNERKKIKERNN